jgi:AcrR family transcriptional regulator
VLYFNVAHVMLTMTCENELTNHYPRVAMARTRSEKATQDVIQAALEVLLEEGVARFTIDAVVARSGVAKSTVYRWWPNRQALLLDAIHAQLTASATPNTGDTRADLAAYLAPYATSALDTPASRLMPDLCAAARRDPELAELRDVLLTEKRQPVITILELARARGEIAANADLEQLATMIIGPLAYTKSLRGLSVDPALLTTAIDAALAYGARDRVAT